MHSSQTRRALALAAAASAAISIGIGAAPAASAASGTSVVPNTAPNWLSHATRRAAKMSSTAKQSVRVYLSPNGGLAALQAKVTSLSTPSSSDYGHWLTPAQYQTAYEPSAASADAVTQYLESQKLTVTGVEADRRYISATGTVSQLNNAFGVSLSPYAHDGQDVVAPSSDVVLPSGLAGLVLTVTGLDTTQSKKSHSVTPPDGFANARPCSTAYGQVKAKYQADFKTPLPKFQGKTLAYAPCGYTGPQFRAAYEGNSALTGAGVTVAITDAYAWQFIARDASQYAVAHGDGSYAAGQLTQVLPPSFNRQGLCDPSGWSGEETLDVEAVHAMAPGAKIRYYASASCFDEDFIDTLQRVVAENKAQFVTNSWSDLEQNESAGSVTAYQQVFLQGGAQGISFLFSSGDDGDEVANSGLKQVDYPASDPYVTGVGGTSTGIDANGALSFQTGWGTEKYSLSADGTSWTPLGFLYGAGGGYSALFNRPAYQAGTIPSGASRAVPDIAFDADPTTGMLIGQTQTFPDGVRYGEYRIGGTSLASPLAAGFYALVAQKSGLRYGVLNPALYAQKLSTVDVKHAGPLGAVRVDYANGVDPADGLLYSARTFDQDSSLRTTKGWDTVTGLGIPDPALVK